MGRVENRTPRPGGVDSETAQVENKTKSPTGNGTELKGNFVTRAMYKGVGLEDCIPGGMEKALQCITEAALCPSQPLLHPAHPQFSSSLSSGLMAGLVRL